MANSIDRQIRFMYKCAEDHKEGKVPILCTGENEKFEESSVHKRKEKEELGMKLKEKLNIERKENDTIDNNKVRTENGTQRENIVCTGEVNSKEESPVHTGEEYEVPCTPRLGNDTDNHLNRTVGIEDKNVCTTRPFDWLTTYRKRKVPVHKTKTKTRKRKTIDVTNKSTTMSTKEPQTQGLKNWILKIPRLLDKEKAEDHSPVHRDCVHTGTGRDQREQDSYVTESELRNGKSEVQGVTSEPDQTAASSISPDPRRPMD